MNLRTRIAFLLLVALLATRLLGVHFHVPTAASGELPHLVALTLVEAHQHADAPDHGHVASHLYEGEQDEDDGTALLAKLKGSVVLFVPLLLAVLVLGWRLSAAAPRPAYVIDSPPRPRRWARLAPPSQAPPLLV